MNSRGLKVAYFSALKGSYLTRLQIVAYWLTRLGAVLALLIGLAGCSGSTDLASTLGLNSTNTNANDKLAASKGLKPVAFGPLVGVPNTISPKILSAVKTAAQSQKWALVNEKAKADYLINGHFTAYPTKTGGKLSYIWDVKDKKGVHLHRVIGSETLSGRKTNNAWSLVNDQVIAKVAQTSTGKINTWLRSSGNNKLPDNTPKTTPDDPTAISPIAKGQTDDPVITGAVNKRTTSLLTVVQPVQGAPGDGRISLTNALRQELKKNGIALSQQKVAGGYTVRGQVKLSKPLNGQQNVQIIWNVYDGQGNRVGTVSQKNSIPTGSLNGAWGPTAEAAASAAAKGIVKLLPSKS